MDFFLRDLNSSIAEAENLLGVKYSDEEIALVREASLVSLGGYSSLYLIKKEYAFTQENTQIIVNHLLKNPDDFSQITVFFVLKLILEKKVNEQLPRLNHENIKKTCQKYSMSNENLDERDFLYKIQVPTSIFLKKQNIHLNEKGMPYIDEILEKCNITLQFRDYMVSDGIKNKLAIAAWDKFIEKKSTSFISMGDDFAKKIPFYASIDFNNSASKDSWEGQIHMTRTEHLSTLVKDPISLLFSIFFIGIIIFIVLLFF